MKETNQSSNEILLLSVNGEERTVAELRERAESDPSFVLNELAGAKKTESAGLSVKAFETSTSEEFKRLHLAFQNAFYHLPFSSFLDYLDAFSKNENEGVSEYARNFFLLLKNVLSRELPTKGETEFFADILPRFIRSYRRASSADESSLASGLRDIFLEHPELSLAIPSIISDGFLDEKHGPKEIEIVSFLNDIEFVSGTMVKLLSDDTSWTGTFFIDVIFSSVSESLSKAKQDHPLSEKEFSAVSDFLLKAELLLPDIIARGQGVLIKKGLTRFLSKHPEFGKTAEKLIAETKEISFSEKENNQTVFVSELEKKRLFGNFDFLGDLLLDIPEADREKFVERLQREMEFWNISILKPIFQSSTAISEKLAARRPIDISKTAHLPVVRELIDIAVKNIEKYRFQIGVLLSLVSFSDLSPETRVALRPMVSSSEQTIKPGHTGWYLCSEAEPRLIESLANDAVVLVNDAILVKMSGKLSGLCVKNYETKNGFVFVEGAWYSPSDASSRSAVREANDRREARVKIEGGEWSLMRGIEDSPAKEADLLLAVAKEYAEKLGNSLPQMIDGLNRKEFRERKIETE